MKQNDKRNAHIPQFPAHPHSSIPAIITAHRRRTATKISGTHNDIISRQTLVHSPERIRAANKRLPPYSTTPLVRPNTRALFFCWFLRLWIREKNRKQCWECCRRGKTRKLENIMGKTRKKNNVRPQKRMISKVLVGSNKVFPYPLARLSSLLLLHNPKILKQRKTRCRRRWLEGEQLRPSRYNISTL